MRGFHYNLFARNILQPRWHLVYLGIMLTYRFCCKQHLEWVLLKAKGAINALFQKQEFRGIKMNRAVHIFNVAILPKLFYGKNCFPTLTADIEDFYQKKLSAYFFKKWAGISQSYHSTSFMHHLFENDYLSIHQTRRVKKKIIAMFYADGLHRLLCFNENCFDVVQSCQCSLCGSDWEFDHMNICSYFPSELTLMQKLISLTQTLFL